MDDDKNNQNESPEVVNEPDQTTDNLEQTPEAEGNTPDQSQENSSPESDSSSPIAESASLDEESPADALTRTPEDLDEERTERAAEAGTPIAPPVEKKPSALKRFFRKVNVYFLLFFLLLVVAGAITIVNYINNQKANPTVKIATQELADKTLEQLANTDVSVGNNAQTLTIQGNAIIAGQTLMRGSTNVAGNLQAGGTIQGPSLTIAGAASLGQAQSQTLQIQNTLAVQGGTSLRDLTVSGPSTFSGPVTMNQLAVTNLIMSGNAYLEVPGHIGFTGPTPSRGAVNSGVAGTGGTVSMSGSDTAGTISIRTGNNTAPGCFTQITFNRAFTRQPRVIVSPVGAAAGQTQYYVNRSTTGFSICTANAAPANQDFSFDYFITN